MSILDDILRFFGLLESDPDAEVFPPIIIVKVLDGMALNGIDQGTTLTLDALATQVGAPDSPALQAVRDSTANLVFAWPFPSVTMAQIDAVVQRATTANPTYEAPKFDHYFEISCPAGFQTDTLVAALNAWTDVVEYAYVAPLASDPLVTGTANPFFAKGQQNYLSAAPVGIGAPAAWAKGADGRGLEFIDVERGWFLKHQDLPQTIPLLQGTNREVSSAHGAGVLGEIVGIDNTIGIVGAAPLATASLISYYSMSPTSRRAQRVHDSILYASYSLPFGNVMLIEAQFGDTPLAVETDPTVFETIRLATMAQVIVVEAAGNGNSDLDSFVMATGPRKGKKTLSRSTPAEFADSGAILVGGCGSAYPHERWDGSNYGSRIDCYAWAENIVTSGWNTDTPDAADVYWGVNQIKLVNGVEQRVSFGGTSGASPIIVGCCLLVQSLGKILTPKSGTETLGPGAMRSLLTDPNNSTPSFPTTAEIGVMPDLEKIIANEFNP